MYSLFQKLIDQGFVLVYSDILSISFTNSHTTDLIEQLHQISRLNRLKLAPEKSFDIITLLVKFPGLEIGNQII